MGVNLMVDISLLSRGASLERIEFTLDDRYTRRYLGAITGNSYDSVVLGGVPPHGIATRAMLALLESLNLPAGTVHVSQSITSHAKAMLGTKLSMLTTVTQIRAVRGYMHVTLSFNIYDNSGVGRLVLQGDTVVMVPEAVDGQL
jgi:hypothetical protein